MTTTQSAVQSAKLSRQCVAELRVRCQENPNSVEIQRAAVGELVAGGLSSEAIPILRRLVNLCPEDDNIVKQLAQLLSDQSNHSDATTLYRKLAEAHPQSIEAQHNYGVAACRAEDYDQAIIAFEAKRSLEPDSYETLNDIAVLYSLVGRNDDASRAYECCLTINPRYDKGRENAFQFFWDMQRYSEGAALATQLLSEIGRDRELETWKNRFARPETGSDPQTSAHVAVQDGSRSSTRVAGKRIAFVASSDTFLKPIVAHFSQHNKVRTFSGKSVSELADLLQWADCVWYEWCDQLAIEGSKLPRKAKTICRLHSYEAFTNMPNQVNWTNIDHLVLVSETVGEILDECAPVAIPRSVIHNGIDQERFPAVKREQRGKRVASIGYINYKKNPSLLLQTFKAIHDWDPEFEFHVAGEHQDPRIKVYMDHLLPRLSLPVTFHGWVKDMPELYRSMDYVISTSLFESFHYSIAEGMLSGCHPLIHSWRGAERLYPNDCLFDSPDEAVRLIQRYQKLDDGTISSEHRNFIIDRYNWVDRLDEIDALIESVLNGESECTKTSPHAWPASSEPVSSLDVGTVTVVIPVHNNARSLTETLDRILDQTYQNTEVIVCDNGSTDSLDHVLKGYEGRVSTVRQIHRSLASAINTGIQGAAGEFIAIVLPGDSCAPDKLSAQLRQFEKTPDLGIATCSATRPISAAPTANNIAAAVNRCIGDGAKTEVMTGLSSFVFRRTLLDEIGWFEESAPYADDDTALAKSFIARAAAVSSVRQLPDELVAIDPTRTDGMPKADSTRIAAFAAGWTSRITAVRDRDIDTQADSLSSDHAPLNIAFVADHDPRGQMVMWADALNQYSKHNVRVLTRSESTGCPSDLVLNRRNFARLTSGECPPSAAVVEEATQVIADADLVVFAVGLAPGSNRPDTVVVDADLQPFGTLEWPGALKDKHCAGMLFGTPSVRNNIDAYQIQMLRRGWPILTCDGDINRWLPDSLFLPRLLSRVDEHYVASSGQSDGIVIMHPGGRLAHEGSMIFRASAKRVKDVDPSVTFGQYSDVAWTEMLNLKRQSHICFDRISVGTGHYGMDSLENSAMGKVNIVYCDPLTRALMAETLGTTECPWVTPSCTDELTEILMSYAKDKERLHNDMAATRAWFVRWMDEERMSSKVASILESLT